MAIPVTALLSGHENLNGHGAWFVSMQAVADGDNTREQSFFLLRGAVAKRPMEFPSSENPGSVEFDEAPVEYFDATERETYAGNAATWMKGLPELTPMRPDSSCKA